MSRSIFGPVSGYNITMQGGMFIVEENFEIGCSPKHSLSIHKIGKRFIEYFSGKVEHIVSGQRNIQHRYLLSPSSSRETLSELGGDKKSKMFLFEIFELLKNQTTGSAVVPLNVPVLVAWRLQKTFKCDGNIFFAEDKNEEVRAIEAVIHSDRSLSIDAFPINDKEIFNTGAKVINRL